MAQAAVGLPDPLSATPPAAPTGSGGTDDLLAQLAGDEIDRLLAEAEVDKEPDAPAAAPDQPRETLQASDPAPSPPAAQTTPEDALVAAASATGERGRSSSANATSEASETLIRNSESAQASSAGITDTPQGTGRQSIAAAMLASPPLPDPAVTEQLDRAFDEQTRDGATPPTVEQPTSSKTGADSALADALDTLLQDSTNVPADNSASRVGSPAAQGADAKPKTAMQTPIEAAASAADSASSRPEVGVPSAAAASKGVQTAPITPPSRGTADKELTEPADSPGDAHPIAAPLPPYLRPLEWLSAPLDRLPDWIRDAIGKIAILTLVNAAAILVYLLLFRRH